jgi:hypothetical protein
MQERRMWRRKLRRSRPLAWASELAGVGLIAGGVAMVQPWLAPIIVGGYLALLANVERGGRDRRRPDGGER